MRQAPGEASAHGVRPCQNNAGWKKYAANRINRANPQAALHMATTAPFRTGTTHNMRSNATGTRIDQRKLVTDGQSE